MPIRFVLGLYLDTYPYRFMVSRGYRPTAHALLLQNDLIEFRLPDEIKARRDALAEEGITIRWYRRNDREQMLSFMAKNFSGGWYTTIKKATDGFAEPRILIATASERIIGFMGPMGCEAGGRGWFGSPGVSPDFRRKGIGTVLWHLGLDYMKQSGATFTEYTTGVTNPARFMYFRSGARLVAVFCRDFHKRLK